MDYKTIIEQVYRHLENDHIDKAVMACLRIARHSQDYLYATVFLREIHSGENKEFYRTFYDDTNKLSKKAQKFLLDRSFEFWIDTRTLDFSLGTNDNGEEQNVLLTSILEIEREIDHWERTIESKEVPPGMHPFDTAAFTDKYDAQKAEYRLRITALQNIKHRNKTRCLNYVIMQERQLQTQNQVHSFLLRIQNDVNNYFKSYSEDVYNKLQKAAELVDSDNIEDCSLLLTQVRRAIKASADFFYPPMQETIKCTDGKDRQLGEEQYLNRLQEYLRSMFIKSCSRDLLKAELDHIIIFTRKLNDIASKGVHAEVSFEEAKQGLLGLYFFLYNVISRLQAKQNEHDSLEGQG